MKVIKCKGPFCRLEQAQIPFVIDLQAYKFQEEYKLAVCDFKQAEALDPAWTEPNDEKNKLLNILTKTLDLLEGKVI